MNSVVKSVLGDQWSVIVYNDGSWGMYCDNLKFSDISTIKRLDSHWREAIKNAILTVVNLKISNALNEV